jgi:hypothetical protein
MYLGIDDQNGLIYEGSGGASRPAVPLPTVTQAQLIEELATGTRCPSSDRAAP